MVYGYIRVSSDKQTVENQRFEINKFCNRERLTIDGWIEETISGTKSYDKRALGCLLKSIKKDDLIICAESRGPGWKLVLPRPPPPPPLPPTMQEQMAQQNEILRQLAQRQPPPLHYGGGNHH